ncbi:MAG: phosphatidate cytidylyltransferase [Pyramidobacter sp.]|nr:phosphatidate cytidylyltransferase [Pyramidobacter sp.]
MAGSSDFKHNLILRSATGTVLVAVLLVFLYFGSWWWHGFAAAVALGSLWEYYKMSAGLPKVAEIVGLAAAAVVLLLPLSLSQTGLIAVLGLACFLVYFSEVLRRHLTGESRSSQTVGTVMSGLAYAVLPWYIMICLREFPEIGFGAVLSVFLCTWSCDVMAYLVGSKCGTRKVCPNVSPGKSGEGFIGGLAASVLCGSLCALFFGVRPAAYVLTGLACGTLGQLGDLAESVIKREKGVKDSGTIFPGHGGFMDRFDSVLVNALSAWIVWELLI